MIAWQEAVDRATAAVQEAEKYLGGGGFGQDFARAQAWAQISYAWSNIGMMVEAQEAAEAEAQDAVT